MGGPGIVRPILRDLGEVLGKDIIDGWGGFLKGESGDAMASKFARSGESYLNKGKSGQVMTEFINKTFEPEVRKTGQMYLQGNLGAGMKPDDAARQAVKDAWMDTRKKYFGKNDEVITKFIATATRQNGVPYADTAAAILNGYFRDSTAMWRVRGVQFPGQQAKTVLTSMGIGRQSSYKYVSENEAKLRSAISRMLTPLIAIPHTAQIANVVLDASIKDTAKAFGEYFAGGVTKQKLMRDVIDSGALFDEIRYEMFDLAKGGGVVRKLFNHPGFGAVRKFEITIAAATGKHAAISAAIDLMKNPNDKFAMYTLGKYGINPVEALKEMRATGQLTDKMLESAMYQGAERTIFFRNALKTPWGWEESFLSRMMAQYKHFMFRQGKFLYENFKNAYEYGGMKEVSKSLAVYATLYPMFGELVHSTENFVTTQNPFKRDTHDPVKEYLDAMAHSAGFGVWYGMYQSSMYTGGKGYIEGPAAGIMEDIVLGASRDIVKHHNKQAARKVISKFSWPGKIASNLMKEER